MEVKKLNSDEVADFRKLLEVFKEVFETEAEIPGEAHLHALLSSAGFMAFVVRVNNQVAGGVTLYVLQRYFGHKPIAYLYDVGIAPGFQGKGLGKLLITEVCGYCRANGFDEVYVEAERDDVGAVAFYRRTKYTHEQEAVHFTYSFNNTGE